ncbi:MAG: MBL fold metallo-hydrolase [Burkholderiales bacterium]
MAVGDASRAGDCIVIRYGGEEDYRLMVVDGGNADSGKALVAHLKAQFGTDVRLEHVVLTHHDNDHASGLRELMTSDIPVAHLWMHIPWFLSVEAKHLFQRKDWSDDALQRTIKGEFSILSEIVDAASTKTKLHYAFQGTAIGPFTVLSPARNAYLHLMPQFERTPAPDQDTIEAAGLWIAKASILQRIVNLARTTVQSLTRETWSNEQLRDGAITSASNESSVVLYGDFGTERVLLTGDAGVRGLTWAADYANAVGFPLGAFTFVQVPHHGSRSNIGPTILSRLVGPIQQEGTRRFAAFVSAPKDDAKHPRVIVKNAFIRRGGNVVVTAGRGKVHWGGFNARANYERASIETLNPIVEAYD